MFGQGSPSRPTAALSAVVGRQHGVSPLACRRLPLWITAAWAFAMCFLLSPVFAQQLELGNPQSKKVPSTGPMAPASGKDAAESTDKSEGESTVVDAPKATDAEDQDLIELNLRLAWGGGKARTWEGQIQINQGTITLVRTLGMEADQARALMPDGQIIHIQQLAANTFHGVDIAVRAPRTTILRVILKPSDVDLAPKTLKIPLASLALETTNATLDQQGNRLQVHRTPGDKLRLKFQRNSLVFSPQESFPITIAPHQLGLEAGTALRCEIHFQATATKKTISRGKHNLQVQEDGSIAPLGPLTFEMPDDEGVYDLHITLNEKSLTDSFLPSKPIAERSLQLVVIAPQPEAPAPTADFSPDSETGAPSSHWKPIVSMDPANPTWWNRVRQMRQFSLLPGMGNGPLNNGKVKTVLEDGQSRTRLDPGGWVAYPLPVEELDRAHLLELDYRQDLPQTLSISIIDPNLAGKVAPIGLDSGIDIGKSRVSSKAKNGVHRLPFWPRSKTPWVLLVNRHPDQPAFFGKLRILQGTRALPKATTISRRPSQRLVTAYFDKPLFPENFGAPEGIDPMTRSSLDDWITFYEGGDRLTRYLHFAGYNAAVVTVMCEGATLYPSTQVQGTPKYDSGIFFTTGQDPIRKDVLEMLLRKFDQRGLTLIPAIQFSSPLPGLEAQLHGDPKGATGIELTDTNDTSWVDSQGTRRGMAPYYNPVDPRVQQQMHRVLDELVKRYSHHPSFGGFAIQMSSESYSQLPGPLWGVDAHTFERFLKSTDEAAAKKPMSREERIAYINGSHRQQWLDWRGEMLADFYHEAGKRLQASKPGSQLYLVTSDLVNSSRARKQLQPKLPQQASLADVLLEMGIDHRRFGDSEHLVLLRPQRLAPVTSLPAQAVNLAMETSPQVDQMFADDQHSGQLFYHEPQSLSLPDFDQKSPFGADNTQTWLVSHFSTAGTDKTRPFVHALATSDIQTLMLGGWMLPVGQEDSLRDLFNTFQHLPLGKFTTVRPGNGKQTTQPVVIRTRKTKNETFIYMVNDCSWPVQVELNLDATEQCLVMPVGNHAVSNLQRSANATTWTLNLKPYDLVAASFTSASVKIQDVQVRYKQEILEKLRREIYEMNYRVSGLNKPKPLDVLGNAGFELPREKGRLSGWVHGRKRQDAVQLDREVLLDGRQSLHLQRGDKDEEVVWVRSQPFTPPRTGRIAISAWLKVKDQSKQPALRLAIEGRQFGKVYYRPKTIGKNEPGQRGAVKPIGDKWTEFLLVVDDLPPRGLTELRVGFDLMSEGEVWIDNVKVYDLWFQESEKRELLKHIALAYNQRSELKVADCERFLTSYWAQFLVEHVPLNQPRVANAPGKASTPEPVEPRPTQPDALTPKPSPSMFDRVKDWIPKKVFPF
ncbi:MAG: family 10 glycosylhydrolase [Planctomycetaceae bacterium]|nr:family 10 glycosylhydrolase [Planctomycetaceae bacterium]